jgi:hypothetical protein
MSTSFVTSNDRKLRNINFDALLNVSQPDIVASRDHGPPKLPGASHWSKEMCHHKNTYS